MGLGVTAVRGNSPRRCGMALVLPHLADAPYLGQGLRTGQLLPAPSDSAQQTLCRAGCAPARPGLHWLILLCIKQGAGPPPCLWYSVACSALCTVGSAAIAPGFLLPYGL